jgi:uncharacterized protein (DUF1778 family)
MSHSVAKRRKGPKAENLRAIDLEGQTMGDFLLHSAESAKRTIQERVFLILSARQTDAFVDALLHPPEPGRLLRSAARHCKNSVGGR